MQHPGHSNGKSSSEPSSGPSRVVLETPRSRGRVVVVTAPGVAGCTVELLHRLEAVGHTVTQIDASGPGDAAAVEQAAIASADGMICITSIGLPDSLLGRPAGAGTALLEATAQAGVPLVVAPGDLDSIRFGARSEIPPQYGNRLFHQLSDHETLMRTDVNDNARLGRLLADSINQAIGPVAVCLPLRGLSNLDAPGALFYHSGANMALFGNLTTHLRRDIQLYDCNVNINDPAFAQLCYEAFEVLIR